MKNKNISSKKLNIKILAKHSPEFPKNLLALSDCPEILFVLGNEKILNSLSISIVGTRNSSALGNNLALNTAKNLSNNNVIIVSGLASGIDTNAHLGSLSSNNPQTIAIIACGFNHIFSSSKNMHLINDILNNNGTILSEYFPDTPPQKFSFLKRNRLIAAISNATIVVEAPIKSGALNTAQISKSLNKPIFAYPWNIDTFRGEGCNNLIQHGAQLLTNYTQVLNCFNLSSCTSQTSSAPPSYNLSKPNIPQQFNNLYKYIQKYQPVSKENIYEHFSNEKIADINSKLLMMELENLILFRRKFIYK